MTAITFDAISYIEELVKVGVPEPQAKVQSKALVHVIDDLVSRDLATKGDIFEVKADIAASKIDLIKWIIGVNATTIALFFALLQFLK